MRRLLWLALAGVLLTLVGAGPASAHAVLVSTQPDSLSVLRTAPKQVTLTFGEQVQVTARGVRVLRPDGSEVDDGKAGHITGRGDTVGVRMASGAQGTYTVAWHVVSADSHPVSGAFTFSVGHVSSTTAAPAQSGSAAVDVLYWASRVLGYAAFALLVGAVGFVLLCWPEGAADPRVRRSAWVGWCALLVASVADALLQGPYGAGVGLGHVFDRGLIGGTLALPLGTGLALRVSLLAVAVPLVNEVLGGRRRAVFGWSLAAVGVGLAATWSLSGHAGSGFQVGLALPLDVLHVGAMGLWLGGLVVVWWARPPAVAVGRFSPVAFLCVVVLVATGAYQSWRQLGSWGAIVGSGYGRVLLIKVGVVVLVLWAAWFSRRWVRDRVGSLRRSVLVETLGAVVVLGLTAALVNSAPPRDSSVARVAAPADRVIPFDTGGVGGSGKLKVNVQPLTVGPNIVTVTVLDAAGVREDVPELDLSFSLRGQGIGPLRVVMRRTGMTMGTYRSASASLPLAGRWTMAVTVRTSDVDETTVSSAVVVG